VSIIKSISNSVLKGWLNELAIEHYTCEHCHGLHLPHIQSLDGVVESRLFVEEWGLLMSTEFQIRNSAILLLASELGVLNANYPTLKVFVDTSDDNLAQLVAGATVLTGAGLSEAQFALFVTTSMEMMSQLGSELRQMNCLWVEDDGPDGSFALH
jgi:hypothetical protein